METNSLVYSQRIWNVYKRFPENFYHEHLESIMEISVLLKYTKEEKLVNVMDKIDTLVTNLENSQQVYLDNQNDIFCAQDLGIAITNIHNFLFELRELLGLKTLDTKTR